MKIAVYAIAKNEAKHVQRFCDSAQGADCILIADTGSTDDTIAEAKRCGVNITSICISPWRFDHARNAVLALLPRGIDVCISLDLDEVLEPGWREEIERVWKPETTRLRYMFDWGNDILFQYEKIHARHGYHWHHPCHEYPMPDARITEVWANTGKLLVSHHPDPTKSRGEYMELLELSVLEDPACPRNAFYYARELTFHKRWEEATDALQRYLDLPRATWVNERCYAMRLLGQAREELSDNAVAESWLHRACAEASNTREPWCALAGMMYRQSRWPECYAFAMRALAIKDRAHVYTCDPAVWGSLPHDYAALAAFNIGLWAVAVKQGRLAVEKGGDDPRYQRNLDFYMGKSLDKPAEAAD